MRARFFIPGVLGALVLILVITRLVLFIQIFFQHSGIPLTQKEIAAAHTATDSRPLLIPKIIHNVYHDWDAEQNGGMETMPDDWDNVRKSCIDKNQDWEFKLWTSTTSRQFIKQYYPWFLNTYDGYRFRVQRIDALRYFLIYHYGGIYMDMDNGCLTSLEPLLYYPTWTTDGGRGALSNNILASVPNHPFWKLVTDSLIPYNYNYFFPYVTISYASGQWFETAVWETYHSLHPEPDAQLHRIMMDDRFDLPGIDEWIYFTQERGGTWQNWDNAFFLWIGEHLGVLGFCVAAIIWATVWGVKRFCFRSLQRYSKVRTKEEDIQHIAWGEMYQNSVIPFYQYISTAELLPS